MGWTDGHTGGRGLRADERTGGQTGGQAGGRADRAGHAGRTSGRGRAKARTGGWTGWRLADWRTGGRADDGFPKVKLPI